MNDAITAGSRRVNQPAPDEQLSNGRDDVRQNVKTAQFSRAERKQTSGGASGGLLTVHNQDVQKAGVHAPPLHMHIAVSL